MFSIFRLLLKLVYVYINAYAYVLFFEIIEETESTTRVFFHSTASVRMKNSVFFGRDDV